MASRLTEAARYTSSLSPDELLARVRSVVEPLDGGFQFVSKLSGGGVVVRVLRAPPTDRRWFGTVRDDGFSVALVSRDGSGSPFQPIVRGQVHAEGGGSELAVELAPHPDARAFSVLFVLGGALLGGASLLVLSQSTLTGVVGLGFALLFFGFPGIRARLGFRGGCQAALKALETELGLGEGSGPRADP